MFQVGIVGCGGIAQVHAAALNAFPGVQLRACCDIVGDKARAMALLARDIGDGATI